MTDDTTFRLTPGKRVLFLTKDPELIRKQVRGELDLRMEDLSVEELLDDPAADAKQVDLCGYCHATPGADGDHSASLPAETEFVPLWNKGAARTTAGRLAVANNIKVPLAVLVYWLCCAC